MSVRRYVPWGLAYGPVAWATYLSWNRFRTGELHRLRGCADCGSVFPEHRCHMRDDIA